MRRLTTMKNINDFKQQDKTHYRSISASKAEKSQSSSSLADQDGILNLEEYRGIIKFLGGSQELRKENLYQDIYNAINYAFDQTDLKDIPNIKKKSIIKATANMLIGDSIEEFPSYIEMGSDFTNERIKDCKANDHSGKKELQTEQVTIKAGNESTKKQLEEIPISQERKDLDRVINNLKLEITELNQKETINLKCQIPSLGSQFKKNMQDQKKCHHDPIADILQTHNQNYNSKPSQIEFLDNHVKALSLELHNSKKEFQEFRSIAALQLEAKELENLNLSHRLKNVEIELKVIKDVWDKDNSKLELKESVLREKRDALRKLIQAKIMQREKIFTQ